MSGGQGSLRQAMVLAAGFGERLRPISEERAKPSVPFFNMPLIWHVLALLQEQGVREAAVNLHHAPETLTRALEASIPEGMKVHLSVEPSILGTAGGVRGAMRYLDPGKDIVVANGDSVCDADLAALGEAHGRAVRERSARATLVVTGWAEDDPYNPVQLDADGMIFAIGRDGAKGRPATFTGLSVLAPEAIAAIPREGKSGLVKDLFVPWMAEGERIGAYRHEGIWVEMGTPRLYLEAHLKVLRRTRYLERMPPAAGSVLSGDGAASFVGPGWEAAGAAVDSVVAGAGARVGEGARLKRCVLGKDVVVAGGASAEGCVLWDGVRVEEGAELRDTLCVRGDGGEVESRPLR